MSPLYPEPTVARVSGIRKGILAEERKTSCTKGPDWILNENSVVCYTAAGLQKICAALKLDQAGLLEELAEEIPATTNAAATRSPEASAAAGEASERDGAEATTLLASEKIPSGPSGPSGPAVPAERPAAGTTSAAALPTERVDISAEITIKEGLTIDISPGTPAAKMLQEGKTATQVLDAHKKSAQGAAGVIAAAADQAASAVPIEVTITSVPVNGNRRLLYGTIEDPKAHAGHRRVSVRVRDNAFFLPGFVVRATAAAAGYYNFDGRLPRWRGDRFGFTTKPKPKDPDGGAT